MGIKLLIFLNTITFVMANIIWWGFYLFGMESIHPNAYGIFLGCVHLGVNFGIIVGHIVGWIWGKIENS